MLAELRQGLEVHGFSDPRGQYRNTQKPLIVQPPGYPVISNPFQVASCKCDGNTFDHYCKRAKNLCEEPCFENVQCIPGKGCEACPPHLTGDGRHCAGEPGAGPWQEEALGTGRLEGLGPGAKHFSPFSGKSLEYSIQLAMVRRSGLLGRCEAEEEIVQAWECGQGRAG